MARPAHKTDPATRKGAENPVPASTACGVDHRSRPAIIVSAAGMRWARRVGFDFTWFSVSY